MTEWRVANGLAKIGDDHRGTFRDSLRAPIHRWFSYPVGFSPSLISDLLTSWKSGNGGLFFDPFAGIATALLAARRLGYAAHGTEAHPFICYIGRVKLRDDASDELKSDAEALLRGTDERALRWQEIDIGDTPALLRSCFSDEQLGRLIAIRDHYRDALREGSLLRDLCDVALAAIARRAARVSTKWPYVQPKRLRETAPTPAAVLFSRQLRMMVNDLLEGRSTNVRGGASLIEADARCRHPYLEERSVDWCITSAPYLNNFDYADRTRLETYLLGIYSSWREITENVRRQLMVSATTQVSLARSSIGELLKEVRERDVAIGTELEGLVKKIGDARMARRSDKLQDIVVAWYFSDMLRVLDELRRLMRPDGRVAIVLGDSVLFGIHVETDDIVARLAVLAGFRSAGRALLRSRGAKWKYVRGATSTPLRESLVTLKA